MRDFSKILLFIAILGITVMVSCKDEDDVAAIPSTFAIIDTSDTNYPVMVCTSEPADDIYSYLWDFGNGTYGYDDTVTAYYPFPGEYYITLYVTSAGGTSTSVKDTFVCHQIAPALTTNLYYRNLTYNPDSNNYEKRWVLSTQAGHISTGPSLALNTLGQNNYLTDPIVEDYLYPANHLLTTNGTTGDNSDAYKNAMTFHLIDYAYKNTDSAKWIVNWVFANNEFGYSQAENQDICINIIPSLDTAGTYGLEFTTDSALFLTLDDKNFLLYYEGKPSKTEYQVLVIRDDLLMVRKLYYNLDGTAAGYRMLRYVPEGKQNDPLPTDGQGNLLSGSIIKPPTN